MPEPWDEWKRVNFITTWVIFMIWRMGGADTVAEAPGLKEAARGAVACACAAMRKSTLFVLSPQVRGFPSNAFRTGWYCGLWSTHCYGWIKCSSLACSISRCACSVPSNRRPPYRSQPKIGWPNCWQWMRSWWVRPVSGVSCTRVNGSNVPSSHSWQKRSTTR